MKTIMKTIILGGGTFEPIRNHLALSAPAFGTTAKELHKLIPDSELVLTKMADATSTLKSNDDVKNYINELLEDENVKGIILNVAFCDFKVADGDFHGERLKTNEGDITLELTPTEKIIRNIRVKRPDIFLVGFKTTTNKSSEEQFYIGLKMMKQSKCNLVLANDTVTRNNLIITPEESIYSNTINREDALNELVEMYTSRLDATYNRTKHIDEYNYDMSSTSETFQTVLKFLIDNGGYICNNGNNFTPGHFCEKKNNNSFYSSQRKANHNLVFDEGLSLVKVENNNDNFTVYGRRKASVGARSQWLLLQDNPDYDCIIHTHNPIKENSDIPVAEQKPFQCGSLECGMNTLNNLKEYDNIKAVYLNKHGSNIMFKSTDNPDNIIQFIKDNLKLGVKTT